MWARSAEKNAAAKQELEAYGVRVETRQVDVSSEEQVIAAYEAQRCDAYTTDKSTLAARLGKLKNPGAHVILPETISKAANGPVVRQGDGHHGRHELSAP